jgi:tripartite-type tricarboxylate transporter receptor subunit TctC
MFWTKEDESFLISNYNEKTAKEIARAINKSEGSVQAKSFQLNLKKGYKKLKVSPGIRYENMLLKFQNYGTADNARLGTSLKNATNKNILSVQYKGAGPAVIDLIAGRTAISMQFLPNVSQYIDTKQLVALGVINDKRLPQYPDIPTFVELGYKNFGFKTWIALLANPRAPQDEIKKLQKMLVAVLADKEKSKEFQKIGLVIEPLQTLNTKGIINSDVLKIRQYFEKYGSFEQQ